MTTYKELKGTNIEVNSSDPSNPLEGQVWFNSTSNVLKGLRPNLTGSWSTSSDMNTARYGLGAAGNASAGLAFGGYDNTINSKTEEWNGTNWTETNDLNTGKTDLSGSGTVTAGLAAGGNPTTNNTEEWTGAGAPIGAWATITAMNTARYAGAAAAGPATKDSAQH